MGRRRNEEGLTPNERSKRYNAEHNKQIPLTVSKETVERWDKWASALDMKRNTFIRMCVEERIERMRRAGEDPCAKEDDNDNEEKA